MGSGCVFSKPAAIVVSVRINREPVDPVQLVRYDNIVWADFTCDISLVWRGNLIAEIE